MCAWWASKSSSRVLMAGISQGLTRDECLSGLRIWGTSKRDFSSFLSLDLSPLVSSSSFFCQSCMWAISVNKNLSDCCIWHQHEEFLNPTSVRKQFFQIQHPTVFALENTLFTGQWIQLLMSLFATSVPAAHDMPTHHSCHSDSSKTAGNCYPTEPQFFLISDHESSGIVSPAPPALLSHQQADEWQAQSRRWSTFRHMNVFTSC